MGELPPADQVGVTPGHHPAVATPPAVAAPIAAPIAAAPIPVSVVPMVVPFPGDDGDEGSADGTSGSQSSGPAPDAADVPNVAAENVENVQGPQADVKYDRSKIRMNNDAPGNAPVLERRLWHGTRRLNPKTIASSAVGWCATFANQGSCGSGSYFAPHASYSINDFASRTEGGSQVMLVDVLTGMSQLSCKLCVMATYC